MIQSSMSNGTTKRDALDRTDTAFLRSLASELNGEYFGSYREYSDYGRDEILDLVVNKLTVEEVNIVLSRYLLCHSPRDIAEAIKPDETSKIKEAVKEQFGDDCIFEVKINDRYCDVAFPDRLIAVEVKSARDRAERAVAQTDDYKRWADEVYLAYDDSLEDAVPDQLSSNGVGLLRYENGSVEVRKEAESSASKSEGLLMSMTYDELKTIAKGQNISASGAKKEISSRIAENLSERVVREAFADYLRSRGASEV